MGQRKALPPTYFWLSVILMICLHYAYPVYRFFGYPYNLLGIVPLIIGLCVNMWCSSHFRRVGTAVKPFEESTVLVTHGPFKHSRHPMYLGMLLALIGLSIVLATLTPVAVIFVFVWIINRRFVIPEERALEATFGDDYLRYAARVRRWI